MGTRAVWTGAIAFGLVNIPIELHRAIRETRPRFRLLHAKDKSPVRFERVCERDNRTVAWSEVVKGYEYAKGKFVVLTPEDMKRAALEKTRTLDILNFVPGKDIDDRFFETPYYVVPGRGGERAYVVLREALRESGKTGVGKIMLRETQHLAALEPMSDALVLTMMRFPNELADLSEFRFPRAAAQRPKEVQMAKALIDQLSAKWDPEKYTDEYEANLLRLIRAKLKSTAPRLKEERPDARQEKVVDLMERLRQSLAGSRSAASRSGAGAGSPRAGRAARRAVGTTGKGKARKIA
jgi:DNA end-binding protein Ku